jgi:DUF4097 and DUF4098 domain-containing protein YvlB
MIYTNLTRAIGLALGVTTLLGTAAGAETVERSFDIAADGEIEITNIEGSIDVRGWDRARVDIAAELDGDPEMLRISHDDHRGVIKVEAAEGWRGRDKATEAELTIDLPRGVRLRITSVSADVTVRDHDGDQRIESVSGDIEVDGGSLDASVKSISGDVEFRGNGASGNYEISAVSGDAVLLDVGGDIRVGSVSGDAQVRSGEITDARLESVSGDVELEGQLVDGARLRAETVSGEVDLRLCERQNIAFELETFSGSIRDRVTGRRPKEERFGPGQELRFTEGTGSVRVRVNTMSGNIDIHDCD